MASSTYCFRPGQRKHINFALLSFVWLVCNTNIVYLQDIPSTESHIEIENAPETDEIGPNAYFPATADDASKPDEVDISFINKPEENEVFDGRADEPEVTDPIEKEPVKPDQDPTLIKSNKDFYSHSVYDISGNIVSLQQYRGKVSLVVNVASECGFTDGHYKALIRLQNILGINKRFTVLAFPCNQFGAQEPGKNADIQRFIRDVYHVNFPVFSKINVMEADVPGAWKYITETSGETPNWNFWKYLVNEEGQVLNAWGPWTPVEDIFHEIKEAVDKSGFNMKSPHPAHGGEL